MPESVLCVFVCTHACAYALNATIHAFRLLIQTTMEHKSINNRAIIQKKKYVILVQRVRGEMRGEGATRLDSSQQGYF